MLFCFCSIAVSGQGLSLDQEGQNVLTVTLLSEPNEPTETAVLALQQRAIYIVPISTKNSDRALGNCRRMVFRVTQVLSVFACVLLSTSFKIEVKPRWIYKHNTKSLPDSIEFDLELENNKITLNLIKQPTDSNELPLIITKTQGQSSIGKHSEDFTGAYKDHIFDASATVTVKKAGQTKEIYYIISFVHGDKSFSLGPRDLFGNDPFLNNADIRAGNERIKTNVLNVDGVTHLLFETSSIIFKQDRNLVEDYVDNELKDMRIKKRSTKTELKKRLLTVEIFTMMDYSLYRKFFEKSTATNDKDKNEEATKNIIFLFTHIMEKVKMIFERIEIKHLKFTTKWVGTFISKNASDTPFIESSRIDNVTIDDDNAYNKFGKWRKSIKEKQNENFDFPSYDFFALFTGYTILSKNGYLNGRSTAKDICRSLSHTIIRYRWFHQAILTLAHELGHSLGMFHDDMTKCHSNGNIMEQVLMDYSNDDNHKSYFFSECSINHTIQNIRYLDRIEKNCLTIEGNETRIPGTDIFLELYPGQIYDPDYQCRTAYGPESRFEGGDSDMCQILKCTQGSELKTLDGTICSNGAWCRKGKCRRDRRAPRAPDRCVYGDYKPSFPIPNSILKWTGLQIGCEEAFKYPYLCNSVTFRQLCCASCAGNPTINGGCQDTINKCRHLEPRDCYYGYYATACCKTCKNLVQNTSNSNCLYGDKGTNCLGLIPEVCHLSSHYCCQSCATYLSSTNSSYAGSCTQGDFKGTLSCQRVLGEPLQGDCKSLVNQNPNFCNDSIFKKYCCASCSGVENTCIGDDDKVKHQSKNFTCRDLVEYNPSLCQTQTMKANCCKSCGRLTVRPV